MSRAPGRVQAAIAGLAELEAQLGAPSRYLVAFSGGLDSTVLLHALAAQRPDGRPVEAVHVNHGLQDDAQRFAEFCRDVAGKLGVGFTVLEVEVDTSSGSGVEAAAREARYAAIASIMRADDWLLSAHHADDQVETLLLNLLRGSGPDGLAAMPLVRRLGPGWLVRPFLGLDRSMLEAEAAEAGLDWVDDPTNAATDFDRNYLRHEVLPVIERRWPDAVRRLSVSVNRARDAREILADTGAADLADAGEPDRLDISRLVELPAARRRNVIRVAARTLGLPLPPGETLDSILRDLLPARPDASPLVSWPGAEARRYREGLYLMPPLPEPPSGALPLSAGGTDLPRGLGRIVFETGAEEGLSAETLSSELTVRWRSGGEALQLVSGGPTKKLKTLLQESAVVPWMRERLPLVYAGDELVAVADLYIAASATTSPGARIRWLEHPPMH